jgi:hypothetical protein
MYTRSWGASYATNKGQYRGSDHYTISDSYTASSTTNTDAANCPNNLIKYNIDNGDTSGWDISVSNEDTGVKYVIDKQYSKTGTTKDAVVFIFPDTAPQYNGIPGSIHLQPSLANDTKSQ